MANRSNRARSRMTSAHAAHRPPVDDSSQSLATPAAEPKVGTAARLSGQGKPADRPVANASRPARRAKSAEATSGTPAKQARPNQVRPTQATPAKPDKPAAEAKPAAAALIGGAARPFAGQRWAFFGDFAVWPSYHGARPEEVAISRGAIVTDAVDDQLDVVVFGDRRGLGRSAAKPTADKLAAAGRLVVLDEAAYRERVRIDLTGKRFAFAGGFDCSPAGLEDGLLARMVEATGAVVTDEIDARLDYLAVGNRRGPRKLAMINQVARIVAAGAAIVELDEHGFLERVRIDQPATTAGPDFAGFISRLYGDVDHGKLGRALDMLRKDRFSLYARRDDAQLVGVVRSQRGSGTVYASWLTFEGHYGCMSSDLEDCRGLQGSVCKHLLVLVVGLARSGELAMAQALAWIHAAAARNPRRNVELCAETFVQYKGAEAGELDWRPTETIPEDFYAL